MENHLKSDIELKTLIDAAQVMFGATADLTDQKIVEARVRLAAALKCGEDRHDHEAAQALRRSLSMAAHPYPMGIPSP